MAVGTACTMRSRSARESVGPGGDVAEGGEADSIGGDTRGGLASDLCRWNETGLW